MKKIFEIIIALMLISIFALSNENKISEYDREEAPTATHYSPEMIEAVHSKSKLDVFFVMLKESWTAFINFIKNLFEHSDEIIQTVMGTTPKCSNEGVHKTLRELYTQTVANNALLINTLVIESMGKIQIPKTLISFNNTRATDYNKDILKRTCVTDASYYAPCNEGCEEEAVGTIELHYTVQTNEKDSNQYWVELSPDFINKHLEKQMQ